MSTKKVDELVKMLREADESLSAPAGEKAKEPGADANGETEANLDQDVKDLDKPQEDHLVEGEEQDPAEVIADGGTAPAADGALSPEAEKSKEELESEIDPDIAQLIRAMNESESMDDEEEKKGDEAQVDKEEDKEEDNRDKEGDEEEKHSEDEKESDEDGSEKDPEFNEVDNITLGEDEVKDIADKSASDEAPTDEPKKDESPLPGSDEMTDEQKHCLRMLFNSSVTEAVKTALPKAVKLTEARLNEKFKGTVAVRDAKLNEQINHYLKYAIESWTKTNAPVLQSAAKVKAAERIFESLKTLCELYDIETIDVTQSLVKMYEARISKLESTANKLISENAGLTKEVSLRDRALVIEEASKGLPMVEVERFRVSAAKVKAGDLQSFKENVSAIRATLVAPSSPKKSESVRATNEGLVAQGGVKGAGSKASEADFIAAAMSGTRLNNK